MWIDPDANDSSLEHLTDEEILKDALGMNFTQSDENSKIQKKLSHNAALDYVESHIQYSDEKDDTSLYPELNLP